MGDLEITARIEAEEALRARKNQTCVASSRDLLSIAVNSPGQT